MALLQLPTSLGLLDSSILFDGATPCISFEGQNSLLSQLTVLQSVVASHDVYHQATVPLCFFLACILATRKSTFAYLAKSLPALYMPMNSLPWAIYLWIASQNIANMPNPVWISGINNKWEGTCTYLCRLSLLAMAYHGSMSRQIGSNVHQYLHSLSMSSSMS